MAPLNEREDLYRAVFPGDVHLASSKNTDGAFRGAVLDNVTNVLSGQAEFVRADVGDDHSSQDGLLAAALGVAAGVLGTVVVIKAAPSVKSWWLEDARPTLKATWGRVTKSRGDESQSAVLALVAPPEIEPPEFSVDAAESG